jgi:pyridoxine 5-phosphate synthase
VSARLSINVNKIATVRNSRGGRVPSVLDAVQVCIDAGAHGITVHPRSDARHITSADVHEIAAALAPLRDRIEYNIEGDPRPDWIDLVHAVRPHQCTLVPVGAGEITSHVGYTPRNTPASLAETILGFKRNGIRVSLFVDPEPESIDWAASLQPDRVELYTEPYARAAEQGERAARESYDRFVAAAERAAAAGLGINAGHDLDLDNLVLFRELPHLAEVSIGHAIISRAIFVGLDRVVREYLDVLAGTGAGTGSGAGVSSAAQTAGAGRAEARS